MTDKVFVLEWVRYATNDLFAARHLFEDVYPKQTEIAAWHSHQCAEKALKAFLVANDIDPPKIHDLEKLVKLSQNIDAGFLEIQNDCQKINLYGSAARYPNELDIDETIVKTVIERAQKIYDFCVIKINQWTQDEERKEENGVT
jgi:HEPN domain-containing protein